MVSPLVEMQHIHKSFNGVPALKDISFDIRPGEVHVLLGENGAGKSTLMKILSGAYTPDSGKIIIQGMPFSRLTPELAQASGISIIYQELSVINELSIEENIFLGRIPMKKIMGLKVTDNKMMSERTKALMDSINLSADPTTPTSRLSISEKQMLEIVKAVAFNAQVIVMDEPTSSLTEEEVGKLFEIVKKLKAAGKGIVYISHRLRELKEIGDRITVLKDGTSVGTMDIKDVTIDQLITMMVGRELKESYIPEDKSGITSEKILEVKHLSRKDNTVKDVSFDLFKGEILGFSGLVGAGRTETMCAIYGAAPKSSGEVILCNKKLSIDTPFDGLREGIGLVTENRRETGFFKNFSISRNIILSRQLQKASLGGVWGLVDDSDEVKVANKMIGDLQIKCVGPDQNITELSGGNQQKCILAKWLSSDVKLVIFDEPTKGIDIGTKSEIYKIMRKLTEKGIGVIVVSSELPELLSICDRIIVMKEGSITATFDSSEATEEKLIKAATIGS
ncbi:Galactose/methyl galactoside import ATP-binding protein MglA [Anaerobiospirillum thomasii]|uniref:sugar ABC transporter ATP-binding protein n=1 Tax=Anaerobiospirillum thomasii TaxID=179995 RepID=UPI000D8CEDD3|nr:ATP-binding cassette domain-containing protein [Anaerobiospirillum thomasii]SPT71648.1 Galactose/methyl galactoside import ATP-binding protein MglA [Anaerobiospirillum thomasii]